MFFYNRMLFFILCKLTRNNLYTSITDTENQSSILPNLLQDNKNALILEESLEMLQKLLGKSQLLFEDLLAESKNLLLVRTRLMSLTTILVELYTKIKILSGDYVDCFILAQIMRALQLLDLPINELVQITRSVRKFQKQITSVVAPMLFGCRFKVDPHSLLVITEFDDNGNGKICYANYQLGPKTQYGLHEALGADVVALMPTCYQEKHASLVKSYFNKPQFASTKKRIAVYIVCKNKLFKSFVPELRLYPFFQKKVQIVI